MISDCCCAEVLNARGPSTSRACLESGTWRYWRPWQWQCQRQKQKVQWSASSIHRDERKHRSSTATGHQGYALHFSLGPALSQCSHLQICCFVLLFTLMLQPGLPQLLLLLRCCCFLASLPFLFVIVVRLLFDFLLLLLLFTFICNLWFRVFFLDVMACQGH